MRFKNELERNITIKLGYANAKIYKAKDPRVPRCAVVAAVKRSMFCFLSFMFTFCNLSYHCGRPWCYKAYGSSKEDNPPCDCPGFEDTDMELERHVSFVDCPGMPTIRCTLARRT